MNTRILDRRVTLTAVLGSALLIGCSGSDEPDVNVPSFLMEDGDELQLQGTQAIKDRRVAAIPDMRRQAWYLRGETIVDDRVALEVCLPFDPTESVSRPDPAMPSSRATLQPSARIVSDAATLMPEAEFELLIRWASLGEPGLTLDAAVYSLKRVEAAQDAPDTGVLVDFNGSRSADGAPSAFLTGTRGENVNDLVAACLAQGERVYAELGADDVPADVLDRDEDGFRNLVEFGLGLNGQQVLMPDRPTANADKLTPQDRQGTLVIADTLTDGIPARLPETLAVSGEGEVGPLLPSVQPAGQDPIELRIARTEMAYLLEVDGEGLEQDVGFSFEHAMGATDCQNDGARPDGEPVRCEILHGDAQPFREVRVRLSSGDRSFEWGPFTLVQQAAAAESGPIAPSPQNNPTL